MPIVKEKKPYIVYLTRKGMVFGGDSLKELVTVEFAPDVFVDLEFPNIRSFNNQILTAVELYGLRPGKVIFVLNQELYYSQQFATANEDEIKNYLSIIPFSESVSKRFPNAAGLQLVAISRDLVDPLVEVFTHHGFEVVYVLPDFAFGESLRTIEQFTPEVIEPFLDSKNMVSLEAFSFYSAPKAPEGMTSIRDSEGRIFNPRLIGMIVFFIVLIGILIAVLYMNGYIGKPKPAPFVPPPPAAVEGVVPTATLAPETTPIASSSGETSTATPSLSPNVQKNIIIEVVNDDQTASLATQIKSRLSALGFSQIKTGTTTSAGQRTLILYKPTVSTETLQAIVDELTSLGLQSSAQENPDLTGTDVRITPSSS